MVKDKGVAIEEIEEEEDDDKDDSGTSKLLVPIVGNWYLASNTRNWILQKKSPNKDKNGNDSWNDRMYFSNLESALKEAVLLKLRKSEADSIEQILINLKSIKEDLYKKVGVV